jgi:predicted nuclease with TOPRIM domain
MKNKVEELVTIISLVKGELKSKEKALVDAGTFNPHTQSMINSVEKRILALESDATEIEERYYDKPDVFVNFRKRASEIMKEIEILG